VTTPSTAEVRAWARTQGIDVADRGRLPDELREAYLTSGGVGSTAAKKIAPRADAARPARKAAARKAPATKAAPRTPAKQVTTRPAEPAPAVAAAVAEAAAAAPTVPSPADNHLLSLLQAEVAALTKRLTAVESGLAKAKPSLFRRRQS